MEPILATKGEIPKGAEILSRTQAFLQRFDLVTQHKPLSDVYVLVCYALLHLRIAQSQFCKSFIKLCGRFLLRYGGAAVGSLAAISGLLFLRHFRRCLGLRKEAYISSSLACSMIPCSLSFMHHSIVSSIHVLLFSELILIVNLTKKTTPFGSLVCITNYYLRGASL